MEIEPEIMDPVGRPTQPVWQQPKKWKLILIGVVAIVIGGALLFFMFWIALIFVALGIIAYAFNRIRSWLKGEKPQKGSTTTIRFYSGRTPPKN